MESGKKQSVLLGNGINIQFGGKAYSNRFIMSRIIFNALNDKYNSLFNGLISGKEIVSIFKGLLPIANDVLSGKYDSVIFEESEIQSAIHDFKDQNKERNAFEKYYEVPLEDWFLLLRIYFHNNPDIEKFWADSKQGFELLILDAIYNDGRLQTVYTKMNKKVKRFFRGFDHVFTLNYDNNIENLTGKVVYHLHGNYSVKADAENENTVQGFYRKEHGEGSTIKGFEHCFCNALLNYSGSLKYLQTENNKKYIKLLTKLLEMRRNDFEEFSAFRSHLEGDNKELGELIDTYIEHPELEIATDYHFDELKTLSGELHIIGLSPQNDGHIFSCIDKSEISNIVYYYWGNSPEYLPTIKHYQFKSITELWKSLDSETKKYNKGKTYPNTKEINDFFEIFNTFSFDPITREEIIEEANSFPAFITNPICEESLELLKNFEEKPHDVNELYGQLREISRIALREGILPSAFYLILVDYLSQRK